MSNTSASRAQVHKAEAAVGESLANFLKVHASPRTLNPAAQKAMAETLKAKLMSAGVDVEKYHQQAQADLRVWATKLKAQNEAEYKTMQKTIAAQVAAFRANALQFKNFDAPPASPYKYYLLDTATQISSTSNISLAAQNIAPSQNWAEFQFQTGNTDTQEVTIEYSWQNATDVYAVVNVDGYIIFTGEIQADADGGFAGIFPGGTSDAYVNAKLYLTETWNSTTPLQMDTEQALHLHADGGGWFGAVGAIMDQNLFRGFDLQYQLLLVPPGGVLNIQVACSCQCTIDSGSANFIFNTNGRQVLSPAVLVTVVS